MIGCHQRVSAHAATMDGSRRPVRASTRPNDTGLRSRSPKRTCAAKYPTTAVTRLANTIDNQLARSSIPPPVSSLRNEGRVVRIEAVGAEDREPHVQCDSWNENHRRSHHDVAQSALQDGATTVKRGKGRTSAAAKSKRRAAASARRSHHRGLARTRGDGGGVKWFPGAALLRHRPIIAHR
jgi:hypothetical protein